MLGLDNAGKSVAAKGLAGESLDSVVPTVGFSSVSLSYPDFTVYLYDLGGGVGIRGIWSRYFVDVRCFFVKYIMFLWMKLTKLKKKQSAVSEH